MGTVINYRHNNNNNNNNNNNRMRSLALLTMLGTCLGQKPARIGPDGKPLLNRPDVNECMKRKTHMKVGNHNYFLSWREPWHKFEDWDWFNGRNFCRDRCMDLVSFDTKGEYEMFAEIMKRDGVNNTWTSGRKCNFQNKGCDGDHLQPINVNGWFWAGASNARIPATNAPHPQAFWSNTGETGIPQPDNFEGIKEGPLQAENNIGITVEGLQEFHDEACLAVLNDKYQDGIKWHDVACHFRSVIICEDSDQPINLVEKDALDVDVRNTVELGTNAIDVDSLPQLPLNAPAAPVQQPAQQQFQQQQQQPQQQLRPRPQPPRNNGVFGGFFNNFRLPFF